MRYKISGIMDIGQRARGKWHGARGAGCGSVGVGVGECVGVWPILLDQYDLGGGRV
jgi:hypothetical protein